MAQSGVEVAHYHSVSDVATAKTRPQRQYCSGRASARTGAAAPVTRRREEPKQTVRRNTHFGSADARTAAGTGSGVGGGIGVDAHQFGVVIGVAGGFDLDSRYGLRTGSASVAAASAGAVVCARVTRAAFGAVIVEGESGAITVQVEVGIGTGGSGRRERRFDESLRCRGAGAGAGTGAGNGADAGTGQRSGGGGHRKR